MTFLRLASATALAAVVALAAPAAADDPYVPPEFVSVPPALPGDPADVWRLSLDEALRLAVKHNLNVVLEREAVAISARSIELAGGAFEPTLDLSYRHGDFTSPPRTATDGGTFTSTDDSLAIGYHQRFATGLQLDLGFDGSRSRSTSADAPSPVNVRQTASVSLRQPLFRGFSLDLDIPRLAILRARIASTRERHQLAITMADVVERTESAYWDVVAALYRHDLAARSAQRATDQLELTRRQIDAGLLPPSDLISAESTVAQRQLQQVQAELAVEESWDALRVVLNLPREQWQRAILPVEPPTFAPGALTAEKALATALANRPEHDQLDLDVADAALEVRKADNDRLPQIDLGVTGSLTGQDDGYRVPLEQIAGADAPGWTVMLDLSWTPLQRTSRAAAAIQRSQHQIAIARREQLVQTVWAEVRAALRNQESAARQVAAAARFRQLAEKTLELEQRKFLNGTSSNFVVAQRQEELAAAQLAELAALLDHTKAATTLAHATGVLLTERGIALQ